eukprot:TRINITY_DN1660_c0_g1_i3.p1 TRINITY_DN1660_c0_g1~~TRINITY_DN1660_c0_g1_i3.p1  ORF type:complete len:644 (-),score=299.01 TRINITY_DN1660_c0_g1_i3:2360-4186(-)
MKAEKGFEPSDEATDRPKKTKHEQLQLPIEQGVDGVPEAPCKKKKSKATDDDAAETTAPPADDPVSDGSERRKKKKKAKVVVEEEAPEEAEPTMPVEQAADDEAGQRKKKKKKHAEHTNGGEQRKSPAAAAASSGPAGGVRRDFYTEHPDVAALSDQQVSELRESLAITLDEPDAPRPVSALEHCGFPESIVSGLAGQGITKPSAIQAQAWPVALQGRDLVGLAETGSGKTLGFLMPAIVHVLGQQPAQPAGKKAGPVVLVLAPTRELAIQIEAVCQKTVSSDPRLRSVCVYGGVPKEPQIKAFSQGVAICIATPGRLIDLLESGCTTLKRVSFLVLDEADRMLDMGFEPQIRAVVEQMPCADRQTLMFSATWPKEVQKLANEFMRSPLKINIGSDRSNKLAANHMVNQVVEVCTESDKKRKLLSLLPKLFKSKTEKILIFMLYKKNCDFVHRELLRAGFPVACIHGDKKQAERDRVLAEFRSGKMPIVIATDVAARGWDVKDVRYVVNYEFPLVIEDYVHRIGRTARAGASGTAYTYFTEENKEFAQELVQILSESKQNVPSELDQWKHIGHRYQKKTAATALYGTGNWSTNSISTSKKLHIKFDDD